LFNGKHPSSFFLNYFPTLPSARVYLPIVYSVSAVKCGVCKSSYAKRRAGEGLDKDAEAYELKIKMNGTV
jgi:hypothetical protein